MVWTNPMLEREITKSRELIQRYFNESVTTPVFICSIQELSQAVIEEMNQEDRPVWEQNYIRLAIPLLEGKYFDKKNEIWLVEHKGEKIHVILHEMIHSIQQCRPNRENIVDYVCYKLLNSNSTIEESILNEWKEIEKNYGFKTILNKLKTNNDCEDF